MTLNADLLDWNRLREQREYPGLLLGNGASCAVWDGFDYPSLYEIARDQNVHHRFTALDRALFGEFDTFDFERILSAVSTSIRVDRVLGVSHPGHAACYDSIRQALIEAVRTTHVPWHFLPQANLIAIGQALGLHQVVFSTNYDLLMYWAVMQGPNGFVDLLFGAQNHCFDAGNVEVYPGRTVILHPHGGLHLVRTARGRTRKRTADAFNLLDQFGQPMADDPMAVPLFVSEGTPEMKLRAIGRSDYLSFAYGALRSHREPLCVFGHGLGPSDAHIVQAVRQAGPPEIAISIRPGSAEAIIGRKAHYHHCFPTARLDFYDSSTHPLGAAGLHVARPT